MIPHGAYLVGFVFTGAAIIGLLEIFVPRWAQEDNTVLLILVVILAAIGGCVADNLWPA